MFVEEDISFRNIKHARNVKERSTGVTSYSVRLLKYQ